MFLLASVILFTEGICLLTMPQCRQTPLQVSKPPLYVLLECILVLTMSSYVMMIDLFENNSNVSTSGIIPQVGTSIQPYPWQCVRLGNYHCENFQYMQFHSISVQFLVQLLFMAFIQVSTCRGVFRVVFQGPPKVPKLSRSSEFNYFNLVTLLK